jgi:hypothetical protein
MNKREQARLDMLKRVAQFGTSNATEFTTPVPPSPTVSAGQTQAKQIFDSLSTPTTGLIALIEKNATAQASGTGTASGGTTSKAVLRDALMLELRGINRTATAIAEDTNQPQIMAQFRMPWGATDKTLPSDAGAIADAAAAMQAQFLNYEHPATFVADLRQHILDFKGAQSTQSGGEQKQSGATAGFEPLLNSAMKKVKQLDAFMHNFYKSNAEKLGEWKTASHVERQAKAKKAAPAKPNP